MNPILETLNKIKDEVQEAINRFQENCTHPDETLLMRRDANTGNYDPSSDCYWADFWCQECGKHWTVDSDHPSYRLSKAKVVKEWP